MDEGTIRQNSFSKSVVISRRKTITSIKEQAATGARCTANNFGHSWQRLRGSFFGWVTDSATAP